MFEWSKNGEDIDLFDNKTLIQIACIHMYLEELISMYRCILFVGLYFIFL